MKFYSLLAGFALSLGIATMAHAKIVNGNMQGYFTQVYATDLTGNHMAQYDAACKSSVWMLVNSSFYTDYRVNTDSNVHAAYFTYANMEHVMTGALNASNGMYVFQTEQLAQSLKDMHAKNLSFAVDSTFYHGSAKMIFEAVQVPAVTTKDKDDCDCDCHKKPDATVSYQCVLST